MTKVAIVTGSNKGIGLAIVRSLCKKLNGDVYLTSRNDERGHAAVKLLEGEGLKPKYHQLDIESAESVQALHTFILEKYGGVDILINNAGVMFMDSDSRSFNEKVDQTMNINYTSTLNMTQKFLPNMNPGGRLVIVSSAVSSLGMALCSDEVKAELLKLDMSKIDGIMKQFIKTAKEGTAKEHGLPANEGPFGGLTPYMMSKAGATLMGMVYGKQATEEGKGVLVNSCCPGLIDTDLTAATPKEFGEKQTPDEGADTPVYLALLPKDSTIQGRFIVHKENKDSDYRDKTEVFCRGEHSMAPKKEEK